MFKRLIILLLISTNVFSAPEIRKISKGQCVDIDGYVINSEMEVLFRQVNEEKKLSEKLNISLKDLQVETDKTVDILKKRLDNSTEENDRLFERLNNQEKQTMLMNALFFIGGAVLAGSVAIGVSRGIR